MHEEKNMRSQIKEKKNNSGTKQTERSAIWFLFLWSWDCWSFCFSGISVSEVWKCLFSTSWACWQSISRIPHCIRLVWKIRLPRIIAAVLLGGALSVSGFLLQKFFPESDCGPYVLGISSGAKLVVALTMIFLLEKGIMVSSLGMVVAAFAGSLLAMGFVLLISFRVSNMSLSCSVRYPDWLYLFGDYGFLVWRLQDDSNIVNLHNWSMGSFSGMSWEHIRIMVIIVGNHGCDYLRACKTDQCLSDGESYARIWA